MALIDNGDGTPITRRAVPPKTTPSNPPATTVDTKQQVPQQGLVRAVLHSVQPNNNKPATASVLLLNRMPPRPGYSLPQDFGPVYPAGTTTYTDNSDPANPRTIAVTGPYINDPSIFEGGSFVLVDPNVKAVVQLLQGTSNQYPSSASRLLSLHKHTGGLDANGQPAPSQVNLASHVAGILPKGHYPTIPPNTTPVLIGTPVITPDHLGYPVYNVGIQFVVDDNGTTDSPWLVGSQVCAIPVGSTQDLNHGTGKILGDFLTPVAPDANKHGSYACYIGGLSAGVQYNLYVIYEDFLGGLSNYKLLGVTPDTTATKITVNNLPGLPQTLPTVTYNSVRYPVVGLTAYTAVANFTVNYGGGDSSWLAEIRLYAELWDLAFGVSIASEGSTANKVASGGFVNVLDPEVSIGTTTVTYDGEFAPLQTTVGDASARTGQSAYRLSITFVAENGDESPKIPLTLTTPNYVDILKQHFIAMPQGESLTASGVSLTWDQQSTSSVSSLSVQMNLNYNDGTGSGPLSASVTWAYLVALRAYPVSKNVTADPRQRYLQTIQRRGSGSLSAGHTAEAVFSPTTNGSYTVSLGGLEVGTQYDVYATALDYRGNEPGWESGSPLSSLAYLGRSPLFGDLPSGTTAWSSGFNAYFSSQLNGNRTMSFSFHADTDLGQNLNLVDHVLLTAYQNSQLVGQWTSHTTPNANYTGMIPNFLPGVVATISLYYVSRANLATNPWTTNISVP